MTKISVIIPTNKINSKEECKKFNDIYSIVKENKNDNPISKEFTSLVLDRLYCVTNILHPTIDSIMNQTFEDYEVLLCHKYPEDVKEDFRILWPSLRIIKEKSSIWHDLGDEFRTVNNIRNTGLIHTKGELILFLDDYTIFNENLLQDAWDAYQDGYYITARGYRRIRYDENAKSEDKKTRKTIVDKGIYSSYNLGRIEDGGGLPKSTTWTYCCTASLEDCLRINGFDEVWDGNFGGTDQDFGKRLAKISTYKRKLIGNIYEFAHKSPRQIIRNDEILRQICGQWIPKYVKANTWKPTQAEMRRYRKWHHTYKGYLDSNWNKFLDVPMYNIEDLRK